MLQPGVLELLLDVPKLTQVMEEKNERPFAFWFPWVYYGYTFSPGVAGSVSL